MAWRIHLRAAALALAVLWCVVLVVRQATESADVGVGHETATLATMDGRARHPEAAGRGAPADIAREPGATDAAAAARYVDAVRSGTRLRRRPERQQLEPVATAAAAAAAPTGAPVADEAPPLPPALMRKPARDSSPPAPLPAPAAPVTLISLGVPVDASARGNLGPPSVLTSGAAPRDWLVDRWQAASDMSGTPIRGPHWVRLSLARRAPCAVARIELDWETACADDYIIEVRGAGCAAADGCPWAAQSVVRRPRQARGGQHLVDIVDVTPAATRVWELRVWMARPATQWGVSLWQVDVFGSCEGGELH